MAPACKKKKLYETYVVAVENPNGIFMLISLRPRLLDSACFIIGFRCNVVIVSYDIPSLRRSHVRLCWQACTMQYKLEVSTKTKVHLKMLHGSRKRFFSGPSSFIFLLSYFLSMFRLFDVTPAHLRPVPRTQT